MKNLLLIAVAFVTMVFGLALESHAATSVLRVPTDFATIQAAADAAVPGDMIYVAAGTYSENVVIHTSGIRLQGINAVLDGTAVGGTGIGICVLDAMNVEVMGFTVQNFERGIVLINTSASLVHLNSALFNTDKIADAFFIADGIVLIDSVGNTVSQNSADNNGHNGILLIRSSENTVRANQINDNGAQTGAASAGCGIQLSVGGNNNNQLVQNKLLRNDWGILLNPGTATGNLIAENRSHENGRAGIAVGSAAAGNFILQNNAAGNGLLGLAPSTTFDLYQFGAGVNVWLRNQGTSNF